MVASADEPNAVELGVTFRAAADGRIAGLRFYKGPQNAARTSAIFGAQPASSLASATFADKTPGGWQRVDLAEPVAITAGDPQSRLIMRRAASTRSIRRRFRMIW